MAHSGSIIAAGLGKGRINFFGRKRCSVCTVYDFQNCHWPWILYRADFWRYCWSKYPRATIGNIYITCKHVCPCVCVHIQCKHPWTSRLCWCLQSDAHETLYNHWSRSWPLLYIKVKGQGQKPCFVVHLFKQIDLVHCWIVTINTKSVLAYIWVIIHSGFFKGQGQCYK